MFSRKILLVLGYIVCLGQAIPVSDNEEINSKGGLIDRLKEHCRIFRRSVGYPGNGYQNTLGHGEMMHFLHSNSFHSYLPYPPNPHGHVPGSYPPPFGHPHEPFPGHMQHEMHGHHHHPGCNGYDCKPGTDFNHFGPDPDFRRNGYDKGHDHHNCNHQGHKHEGPYHYPDKNEGKDIVTQTPPIIETSFATESMPAPKTPPSGTTTTQGPTYDIDVRYGSG